MAKVSEIAHVLSEVINNDRKQRSLMKAWEFTGREMSLRLTEKEAKDYLTKWEINRS